MFTIIAFDGWVQIRMRIWILLCPNQAKVGKSNSIFLHGRNVSRNPIELKKNRLHLDVPGFEHTSDIDSLMWCVSLKEIKLYFCEYVFVGVWSEWSRHRWWLKYLSFDRVNSDLKIIWKSLMYSIWIRMNQSC